MRQRYWYSIGPVVLIGLVVAANAGVGHGTVANVQAQHGATAATDALPPVFELDSTWPPPQGDRKLPELQPLAYGRPSVSVSTDTHDNVWILQVPSPASKKAEAAGTTIPRVFAFDSTGKLVVTGFGGPGKGYQWPEDPSQPRMWPSATPAEHGIFVDHKDNVWVVGNGHVALKFSRDGKFLLQIGELWKMNGSNDPKTLGSPTDITVDPAVNEVYIADGYVNRRVAVFDADTGAYKRHWGAYGKKPNDLKLLADQQWMIADTSEMFLPGAPPPQQFLSVHCVRVAKDGLVYVCDRNRNRVQVFRRDGKFVSEFFVEPDTPADLGFVPGARGSSRKSLLEPIATRTQTGGFGAPSSVAFSSDPEQRYLYVADNQNFKIIIYRRRDLRLLGSIPTNPSANHYIAVDSKGNIYNSQLQKFLFKGVPSLNERLKR